MYYFFISKLVEDINECSPDPCKNGATCRDLVNNFECTCAAGYDGSNCEYSKF
jgi:Notch-like protein